MKKLKILYSIASLLLCTMSMQSCKEHYITYEDDEYIMFSEAEQLYVVREDLMAYDVVIASTVARNYDRSFAVEVLDPTSTAVEGRDFHLESNNFTIPAGQLTSKVRILAEFDKLDPEEQLKISLKLVMPEKLVMPMYGDHTLVKMQKTNKFNRANFTGWAVVSSLFLYQYSLTGNYQRLVYTVADPDDENSVIIKDFLADGYDVSIRFDDDTDPSSPAVYTAANQVVSDEASVFGMVHGDNHILIGDSQQAGSYFLGHANIAVLYNRFYVENLGDEVGTVGNFLTEIDWVSDEEAMRLKREEGM